MIAQGRQAGRFFTKCGLLFERTHREVDKDDDSCGTSSSDDEPKTEKLYDIFQPKITTLPARLGFAPDLLESYLKGASTTSTAKTIFSAGSDTELTSRRGMFVDFVRYLLTIDPESRPTAALALQHPWMQYAASLSEADIHYPTPSD
jgi:serine/threonine protein kinase